MRVRPITRDELPALLRLYRFLHPRDPSVDPTDETVQKHWSSIFSNPLLRYYVAEHENGLLITTCTLTIVPNLTRALRPYGVIENVVTDPDYQKQGYGTMVLQYALNEAWKEGCYKVMLSTGRSDPATLRFYEKAGFVTGVKTAFLACRPESFANP